MRPLRPLLAACLGLAATAAVAATPPPDFTPYRAISDLNIFDSTRIDPTSRPTTASIGPAARTITLVGTMNYAKGLFAFFDSTEPAYRNVQPVGGAIAGFQISKIGDRAIVLTRDGAVIHLQVTQQLRSADGSSWTVADAPAVPDTTPVKAPVDPTPLTGSPDSSDTLRRLKEKRRKQFNKS